MLHLLVIIRVKPLYKTTYVEIQPIFNTTNNKFCQNSNKFFLLKYKKKIDKISIFYKCYVFWKKNHKICLHECLCVQLELKFK